MKINSLDEFNLNYTKLDYFLNRAFWDLKPKEEVLKNRKSVLLHVTKELTMKKMEYFISSETSLDLHVNKKFNLN